MISADEISWTEKCHFAPLCIGAAAAYGVAKLRTLRSSPHGVHSSVVHVCAHSVRLTEKGRSVAFAEQTASVEAAPLLHFTKSY